MYIYVCVSIASRITRVRGGHPFLSVAGKERKERKRLIHHPHAPGNSGLVPFWPWLMHSSTSATSSAAGGP